MPSTTKMEVPRLLNTPEYSTLFGSAPLHAQVRLLLGSFRSAWGMSFVFFAIHLVLVGYLVYLRLMPSRSAAAERLDPAPSHGATR